MENKTISGYTLLRKLGTGGMAEVWYAENKIGKPAAVKILSKKLCDEQNIIERFENEARIMVKLHHPNIRQVYDYGMIDDRSCIIMEYLEGEDLGSLIKKGAVFTQSQIERWWNQMVSALNYTHKQGIVHRDIKPSNIFITREGNVELLDFGISKVADNYLSTLSGMSMGTPMYMSPEQVISSKHLDSRSDIYSLAVTFVHLLRGKAPYSSELSVYSLHKSIVEEPLDMGGISQEWQDFLNPYLSKKPEDRPVLKEFGANGTSSKPKGKPVIDDTILEQNDYKNYSNETVIVNGVDNTNSNNTIIAHTDIKDRKSKKSWNWKYYIFIISVLGLILFIYVYSNGYPRNRFGAAVSKHGDYFVVQSKFDISKVGLMHEKRLLFGIPVYVEVYPARYDGIYFSRKIADRRGGGIGYHPNKSMVWLNYDRKSNKKELGNLSGIILTNPIIEKYDGDFERITLNNGRDSYVSKVCVDGKWGLIDSDGKFELQPKYDDITDYEKGPGKTKVKIGNKWSFIDY